MTTSSSIVRLRMRDIGAAPSAKPERSPSEFERITIVGVRLAILLALGACRGGTLRTSEPLHDLGSKFSAQVPAIAPDTTPQRLFDSLGTVQSPTGHGAPWVRSIVVVVFKTGTSQPDRQIVVDAVHGRVVGGFLITTDGSYYVWFPGTTFDAIIGAVRTAQAFSQVDYAHPFMMDTLNYGAGRKPPSPERRN